MDGTFKWPDPSGLDADSPAHLTPKALQTLITALKDELLGEKLIQRTWDKTYQPYFDKLVAIAGQQYWASDAALLDAVLRTLQADDCNSSFAVSAWHGFLWRADGRGINHNPAQPRQRRQDLEPAFLETGAIYAMNIAAFRRCGSRFCPPTSPVMLEQVGPEIDTPEDLALCRSIAAQEGE